jgi:hypothetical protein
MNEQNSEAGANELTSPPYKSRSTGLIVFGILTIVLGAIVGLLFLLTVAGQLLVRTTGAPTSPVWPVVMVGLMYLVAGVTLIWRGIGSIQARRWARALLLIFSWSWLLMGIFGGCMVMFMMPKILAGTSGASDANQALPDSAKAMVMVMMSIILGVMFIIMPIIWIFFYQSRHVKATCEARDGATRWTDALPLPVLALCLWLAFSVLMLLIMPLTGHVVLPFFGTFITGLPASLGYLVMAGIWICAICLLYRLDVRGWWLILIAMVLSGISTVLTDTRHSLPEMYQLMGYPPDQVKQFGSIGMPIGWISLTSLLPFIGYILFVKRYMRDKV